MPTGQGPAPARAPRRDAARNDALVLEAARAVFAERGPGASMEDVAARAGVGVGSIYRRFAGKDALLAAIAEQLVGEMDRAAADALADGDPDRGLRRFLEFVGGFDAEKRRYASAVLDRAGGREAGAPTVDKIAALTRRAVAAGALSPDVRPEDVTTLVAALRAVVADEGDWRRFVRIHLAGLRSSR